jgi:hypothetical protein
VVRIRPEETGKEVRLMGTVLAAVSPGRLAHASALIRHFGDIVHGRLRTVRELLVELEPSWAERSRFNALLLSFDIYACMLNDALADIADNLDQRLRSSEPWGQGDRELVDEWSIAVDGLFGPQGVINLIMSASA